MKTMQGE